MSEKRRLFVIDRILLWINYLLCIALLVSYLAPLVSPQKAWIIQFFGLAYPFLLIINLLMILYWLLRQRWHYALFSVVCIAVGWNALSGTIGFHPKTKDPIVKDGKVIRMMTYNVHNFKRYGSNNDISTKQQILQIIKDEEPDVIGIQEFYMRSKSIYNMRDSILAILGSDYYFFEPIFSNANDSIGIAIFSKYHIISHGILPISSKKSENACIYVDLEKGDQKFRAYSVHLQSIRFDPEDYKYISQVAGQGKPDVHSTERIWNKLKIAFLKRTLQVEKVKEHAATCPYAYIIAGDFNDTPVSYAVHEMNKGLKSAFRERGSGLGRTYNGSFPNYQIDYIMVSNQFDVLNYTVIEKKLSDHYAVRSDLLLK
jgi:endonuclease/exonuclease/phosphatase family metal-dependent hydrolase